MFDCLSSSKQPEHAAGFIPDLPDLRRFCLLYLRKGFLIVSCFLMIFTGIKRCIDTVTNILNPGKIYGI